MNVDEEGDGAGTRTGVGANQRTQDGNEKGKRGTGPGSVEESRIRARNPEEL